MSASERRPDRVSLTFETTITYDVDPATGKQLDNGELGELGEVFHVTLWCEGEFAGDVAWPDEADLLDPEERGLVEQAIAKFGSYEGR